MWPDCVDHDYSSVTSKRLPISCGTKVRFRSFYVGTKIEIPVLVFPVEDHPKWTKISAEVAMVSLNRNRLADAPFQPTAQRTAERVSPQARAVSQMS